nr:hypothetical protein [Tanacetum cinerariifolium]
MFVTVRFAVMNLEFHWYVPLSFALLDSEEDGSNRSGFSTHHSASPLNTIIPNEVELTTRGDSLILESANQVAEDTCHNIDNVEDTIEVISLLSEHSPCSQHSNPFDEDTHIFVLLSFVSCHGVSFSSGGSHRQAFLRRNPGGDEIGSFLRGDVGLPVPFVSAWNLTTHSILNEVESFRDMMINLATPAVLRSTKPRLLSSDEYKKSMSDVFNLAISAGWLEGVKATYFEEEVEAFLATAVDYDPECKTTFMSAFVSLFNKSYPYAKKLVESFWLPLGGSPKYMAGRGALNSSGASCVSGNVCHLDIGTWSHPERLVFRVMCVTWPLVLGLIRSVFAYRLIASCVPGNVCHLSIGAWTHPERLALQVTYVAWPLALGLIRGVEQLSG